MATAPAACPYTQEFSKGLAGRLGGMRFSHVKSWVGKPAPASAHTGAGAPSLVAPLAAEARTASAWAEQAGAKEAAPVSHWPQSRIDAVEALWGEGYVFPGGAPETLRLAKPLGLSSSATLLLLGGGLGGPAQAVVERFGAWVASFEADPDLAAIATKRLGLTDPTNHIKIIGWDRLAPSFKRGCANHAMALEPFHGAPPTPVLENLALALRPQGHIVLTELVADQPTNTAAWCRMELRDPALPSTMELNKLLAKLRFDVRVVEDMSDRHMSSTLTGWRDAVKTMESGPRPTARQAATLIGEAELWLLRLRLMRRMGLKLMRWHAISTR